MVFDKRKKSFIKKSDENKVEERLGGSDACQVIKRKVLIHLNYHHSIPRATRVGHWLLTKRSRDLVVIKSTGLSWSVINDITSLSNSLFLRACQSGRGLRLLQSARDLHPDISLARLDQGARWERQMSLRLNKPIKSFITSLITRLTIGHSETHRSRTDLLGIQFRICFLNFRILTL